MTARVFRSPPKERRGELMSMVVVSHDVMKCKSSFEGAKTAWKGLGQCAERVDKERQSKEPDALFCIDWWVSGANVLGRWSW